MGFSIAKNVIICNNKIFGRPCTRAGEGMGTMAVSGCKAKIC